MTNAAAITSTAVTSGAATASSVATRGSAHAASTNATLMATEQIRSLIFSQELSPGEQIRQDSLSLRLGLSRSPLREALRVLTAEGLVRHMPNQGYFVTRLRRDELAQIYLMRRVLERELLLRLPEVNAETIAELHRENQLMAEFADEGSIARLLAINRRFHSIILNVPGLALLAGEVEKLWGLSEAYRAVYLWSPGHRSQVVAEHDLMIAAIERRDIDELIRVADIHRSASESAISNFLPG
jgi:DNA-binding GntR family transcriptional regulator